MGFGASSAYFPGTQVLGPAVAAGVAARPLIRKIAGSDPLQSFMYGGHPENVSPEVKRLMQMQAARLLPSLFSQGEQ